MEIGARFGADF